MTECLPWLAADRCRHARRLVTSFQAKTGQLLLPEWGEGDLEQSDETIAQQLFGASKIIVSHGGEVDPILNYGNGAALRLWELDWVSFVQTPSRLTAEPVERADRELLLAEAKLRGYIKDYRGVRISSTGRRFWIEDVVLWTVTDELGQDCGQAACFDRWRYL
jgi:hypothetical protein